jgi:GntR family histidine utilization transcriptional repressor
LTDRKTTWQDIRTEVLRRIHSRDWPPGTQIPNEADLAVHFGCARATVNRALRDLAETGLLERRRKSGTRVALHPVRTAKLNIPVIRQEIEDRGQTYGYVLLDRSLTAAPPVIQARMHLGAKAELQHLRSLHLADGAPHMVEDRWINLAIVPDAANAPFDEISANEWLLTHTPYTHGEIAFSAVTATDPIAEVLEVTTGVALFEIERTTWDRDRALTTVKQVFAPGYRLRTSL